MKFSNLLKSIDWPLVIPAFLLTLMGLLAIFGSVDGSLYFKKQILFFIIAVVAMILMANLEIRSLKSNSYLLLVLYLIEF